jgi:hypothetical protein
MPKKHKRHQCGDSVCWHGAFSSKPKAVAKAKAVKGRARFVAIKRGQWRYIVITQKGKK